jgi:hypothetical protein
LNQKDKLESPNNKIKFENCFIARIQPFEIRRHENEKVELSEMIKERTVYFSGTESCNLNILGKVGVSMTRECMPTLVDILHTSKVLRKAKAPHLKKH